MASPVRDTVLLLGPLTPALERLRVLLTQAGFEIRLQPGPTVRSLREADYVLLSTEAFLPFPARPDAVPPLGLTARQEEVARLIAQGFTQEEIAEYLEIDITTVRGHLNSSYAKTGAPNAPALVWRLAMATRARRPNGAKRGGGKQARGG